MAIIKRNTVVRLVDGWLYGRVVRVIDTYHVMWICCGRNIHIDHVGDLIADGYSGNMEFSPTANGIIPYRSNDNTIKFSRAARFVPMTSLRKLKQRCTRYHGRNVWKTPVEYEYIQTK